MMSKKTRKKRNRRALQLLVVVATCLIAGGALYGGAAWIVSAIHRPEDEADLPAVIADPPAEDPQEAPEEPAVSFREQGGVTYVAILGHEMILVNKQYSLPAGYGDGLTAETETAYENLRRAAADAGYPIYIISGFRSYATQESIHNNYLNSGNYSYEYVKQMSAEPGHSEHQLGLALDLGGPAGHDLSSSFGDTETGQWLAAHAHEYGFILRYMKDKTWATGYIYEPWHFRYVGVELAQILYDSGLTVEEYTGLAQQP